MKWFLAVLLFICLGGCAHKKDVEKNCVQAGNADIFICDPI